MQLLNPAGIWALSALGAVLALYMLRRRYEQTQVPSTYLWQLAVRAQQVEHPIERLRKNLLMFLQLLLALLIALSLMRPALRGGLSGTELALVFDVSASMSATSDGVSRLDEAKEQASRMLDALPGGSRVSILSAGSEVRQLLTRGSGKQQIQRALSKVRPGNAGARLPEALSLVRAIKKELPELEIVVFSDAAPDEPEPGIRWVPIGKAAENRAIVSLNAPMRQGDNRALARVANYGADAAVTLECTADGVLCDVRSLELKAGETGSVSFALPEGAALVGAKIVQPDALMADNECFAITGKLERQKLALAGKSNIFLEKALLLSGAELVKSTTAEAASIADAELYVFDGELPEALPPKGALLLVNPPEAVPSMALGEETAGGPLQAARGDAAGQLADGLTLSGIQIKRFRPVLGGEPVLMCQGQPAMAYVEEGGRRLCVIGFDLHESNLPMKYDFPVLMHNLLGVLMPDALGAIGNAECGQRIQLSLSARTESAEVLTPSGRTLDVAPPFPPLPLVDTDEIGVYTLSQRMDDGRVAQTRFALSIPPDESDVRRVSQGQAVEPDGAAARYGRELTPYLLMALLTLMLVEWWVSRRED